MPWTEKDIEEHIKELTTKQKAMWVRSANFARSKCLAKGGDEKTCDAQAITQANDLTKNIYSEEEVEKFFGKDTYSADMEVFAVGTWNGDKYTVKDLNEMVEAYDSLKDDWKPPLKLGHGKQLTEQPALGYVEKLVRKGEKLIATVSSIPKIVKEAIEKGLYKKRSSEIWWGYKDKGKTFRRVLKGIALLGSNIPGVTTLKDIEKFFDGEIDIDNESIKVYEIGKEVDYLNWKEVESLEIISGVVKSLDNFILDTIQTVPFEFKDGVSLVIGTLESNPEDTLYIQSWRFDRKKWTIAKARDWLEGYYYSECGGEQPLSTNSYPYERLSKIENKIAFPKEAFLYTPDETKPSTWQLRAWEGLYTKYTKVQLQKVLDSFVEDYNSGKKLFNEKVQEVLVGMCKEFGVDVPKQLENGVKEVNMDLQKMLDEALAKNKELEAALKEHQDKGHKEEVVKLNAELLAKNEQITQLQSTIKEVEELKKSNTTLEKQNVDMTKSLAKVGEDRRIESIKAFVEKNGAKGSGKILPKDEPIITAILSHCPEEKKFAHGDGEITLYEAITIFVESLVPQVNLGTGTHKDPEVFKTVDEEVEAKVALYRATNKGTTYTDGFQAVMAADSDLKERYHLETIDKGKKAMEN